MRLPDLEAWAIFAAVVEHRSFTAAARRDRPVQGDRVQGGHPAGGAARPVAVPPHLAPPGADRGRPAARRARRAHPRRGARRRGGRARRRARRSPAASASPRRWASASPTSRRWSPTSSPTHPGIEIDLHLSDARVDIVAEGFDVALRIADLPDSSLRARRLCGIAHAPRRRARLSRARTARRTHPASSASIACSRYTNVTGPWRFRGADGERGVGARRPGRSPPIAATRCCPRCSPGSASRGCPASSSARTSRRARWSRSCSTGRRRRSGCTCSPRPARCAPRASRR